MGNLTDLILGTEEELSAVDPDNIPINVLPGLDIKGTDIVELATLCATVTATDFDSAFERFLPVSGQESEEGPWVFRFPEEFIRALNAASPADITRFASEWAETEEVRMSGWAADHVAERLGAIVAFASKAQSVGKPVHIWMSL